MPGLINAIGGGSSGHTTQIVVAVVAALIALGGIIFAIYRKAQRIEQAQADEAALFEREVLRRMGAPTLSPAAPAPNPTRAPSSVASLCSSPESIPIASPASGTAQGDGPFSIAHGLAEDIIAKLRIANALLSVEGPVRTRNPEITGTILKLRDQRRIAVLDSPVKQDDPDMEMLITLLDGVIFPGPGKEPLFARRFQYLVSDMIARPA